MGDPVACALILRSYDVHVMLTSWALNCRHTHYTKLVSAAEQQCLAVHTKVMFFILYNHKLYHCIRVDCQI